MNTPVSIFANLLQTKLAQYGSNILFEKNFVCLLRDWTGNKFADETELFLLALHGGVAKQIRDIPKKTHKEVRNIAERFSVDYFLQETKALETVCLLVLLLHGKVLTFPRLENEALYMLWRKQPPMGQALPQKEISIYGGAFTNSKRRNVILGAYMIMESPVSQSEYWDIMDDNPSYTVGAGLPVEGVHWYAAVDFCNRKSLRENRLLCYAIDKVHPDSNNLSPLDLYRWKVDLLAGNNGWRLPSADEWEYAYKINAAFSTNSSLKEWCWDFAGDLFGTKFYDHLRTVISYNKRRGVPQRDAEAAQGDGYRINVNKNRTNYGFMCFSYAGNYGLRLARSIV
jgi:hypothetical protein